MLSPPQDTKFLNHNGHVWLLSCTGWHKEKCINGLSVLNYWGWQNLRMAEVKRMRRTWRMNCQVQWSGLQRPGWMNISSKKEGERRSTWGVKSCVRCVRGEMMRRHPERNIRQAIGKKKDYTSDTRLVNDSLATWTFLQIECQEEVWPPRRSDALHMSTRKISGHRWQTHQKGLAFPRVVAGEWGYALQVFSRAYKQFFLSLLPGKFEN